MGPRWKKGLTGNGNESFPFISQVVWQVLCWVTCSSPSIINWTQTLGISLRSVLPTKYGGRYLARFYNTHWVNNGDDCLYNPWNCHDALWFSNVMARLFASVFILIIEGIATELQQFSLDHLFGLVLLYKIWQWELDWRLLVGAFKPKRIAYPLSVPEPRWAKLCGFVLLWDGSRGPFIVSIIIWIVM